MVTDSLFSGTRITVTVFVYGLPLALAIICATALTMRPLRMMTDAVVLSGISVGIPRIFF